MRARMVLTGAVAAALALSTTTPASALLHTTTGTTTSLLSSTVDSLEAVVDDVIADLGTGTLDADVVDALFATGSTDDAVHDLLGHGWTEYLPAYPEEDYVPSVYKDCPPGHNQCVDQVVREMQRRYDKLGCDHAAIFSLTYKLTTIQYRASVEDPDYFHDNAFVNHQDVVFADYYFDPMDAWFKHGRIEHVPPAWRIAFDAGDRQEVTTTGDVLLGMNAHIRRDLPFVLAAIGIVDEAGESRKPDHDRVNDFLAEVQPVITEQLRRRHDPSFGGSSLPLGLDEHATMHAIRLLREEAWRKAELLVQAGSEEERARIEQLVEADAAMSALAIRTLFAGDDAQARRSHCEAWLAGG